MRTRGIAVTALTLALAASGCGSSDKKASAPPTSPSPSASATVDPVHLTVDQLSKALIQVADLGPGYKTTKADTSPSPGCLKTLDNATNNGFPNAIKYVDAAYAADTDNEIPEVDTFVNSFDTPATAAKALSDLGAALASCTHVGESQDGAKYDLTVTNDDDKASAEVDHQLNVSAVGDVSGPGGKITIAFRVAFQQVGPLVVATGYSNTLTDTAADNAKVVALALERLRDVMGGRDPKPDPIDLAVFTGQLGQ